jgi:Right handed beta helix region
MTSRSCRTSVAFIGCMLLGSAAFAQASRTWVSGVGDDFNPCSRTAPCKTFAGAISRTAAGGEIDALDDAGFGAVTITKSITIDGGGHLGGILASLTNGVNVNDSATATPGTIVVTLRNLSINGFGNGLIGVRMFSGAALILENVKIFGFEHGLQTEAGKTTVSRSSFTNNRLIAVRSMSASSLNVEDSMINTNNVGVQAEGTSNLRLSNNGVYDNRTGFGCGGGTLASAGNNRKANNVGGVVATCTPTVAVTIQ